MADFTLVIPNEPEAFDNLYRMTLGASEYIFRVRYSVRFDRWQVELRDEADVTIRGSLRVIPDIPFYLNLDYDQNLPASEGAYIIPQGFAADNSPPELGELGQGKRIQLIILQDDGS